MGLPNPRPKFGYEKAVTLLELIEKYHDNSWDERRYAYVESLAHLLYISFTDNDTKSLEDRYNALELDAERNRSGFDIVDMDAIYEA